MFGFCASTGVADVQPVLQYSHNAVNVADGIYWRIQVAFMRVFFSPMGKQLVKVPWWSHGMNSSYYDEIGQPITSRLTRALRQYCF